MREMFKLSSLVQAAAAMAFAASLPSCASAGEEAAGSDKAAQSTAPSKTGIDPTLVDKTVNPCDDFYQYACGTWLAKTEIPADRPAWGRLAEMNDRNLLVEKQILEDFGSGKDTSDPDAKKLGDFYAACMDEAKVESAGIAPLQPELDRVDQVADAAGLEKEVALLHSLGIYPMFGFGSDQDFKDATQMIGTLDQGGLGLPDRDYYDVDHDKKPSDDKAAAAKEEKNKRIRDLYVSHVAKMLVLAGATADDAAAQSKVILKLETELAKVSMKRALRRDPNNVYHRLNLEGLVKLAPHFSWTAYLSDLGQPGATQLNIAVPEFSVASTRW